MKNVSNVSVKLHGGMGFALNFDWKSFPHHVWIDAQSRAIDKTLYRHSTADRGNPGYFQTRHLDAFKGENFKAIRQAFDIAVNGLMFEKAIQAKKAKEEKEAADRNATIEHTKQLERYKEAGPHLVQALDYISKAFMDILKLNNTMGNPLGISRNFNEEFAAAGVAVNMTVKSR